jgi:F0F1-type ATP synthase assembly protein I
VVAGPDKKPSWKQIGDYASLGVMMPAATITGYLIGLALDRWLGTNFLYSVFLILGIAAGFMELLRIVSRNSGPS